MDFQALNIFIQVAELNSFTKAAEKLGYSQPTISFQIKQLENELNVQLFDRIGHTITLTDEGKLALKYAQKICNMSQEMIKSTTSRYEAKGNIRIGIADSLCSPLITNHFESFKEKYPNITLCLLTGPTDECYNLLNHNEVDIICTLDSKVHDTSYIVVDEEKIEAHIVVSTKHPLANKNKVTIKDLLNESFLLTEKGRSYRRLLDEYFAKENLEIQPILEMSNAHLLCELVENNMGISFLPDYVTQKAVNENKIKRIHVEGLELELWRQLSYHRDKWLSLELQAIIEHLKEIKVNKGE